MTIQKATHFGQIKIGDFKIPCAVLSDGKRVITESGINKTISGNIDGSLVALDQEDNILVIGQPTWYPILGIDPVGGNGWMYGSCKVNGIDGYNFELAFWDYREKVTMYTDWVVIRVYDGDWTLIFEWWSELNVGNIRVAMP